MKKEEVCKTIKLTANVNTARLGFFDQLRLLFSKVSNSDEEELKALSRINVEKAKRISALTRLFETAIAHMKKKNEKQVALGVSSEFLPYIDEVTSTTMGMGRYYDFEVHRRDLPKTVKHLFTVVIRLKEK